MAVTDKTRRALKEIGLTDYEVATYIALLEDGPCTASQASKGAQVPYSKIYDVLASLETKGWVEIENTRPKKYFPKPPSEALEATRLTFESNLQSNLNQVQVELRPLYTSKEIQERPDIWIVRGDFNILARIREGLNTARHTLMIAMSAPPGPLIEILLGDLQRLKDAGVEIRLMITKDVGEKTLHQLSKLGEVRIKERMFGGGVISDGKRVVLILGSGDEDDYLALCSDHIGLASLAREYFEFLWNDAQSK